MVSLRTTALLAAFGSATFANAHLNIVLTNDDGFGSANIRALHNELIKQNHSVLIVGPAEQQSATGGITRFPTTNLTGSGGFDLLTPGASYAGMEPGVLDPSITYFNSTPVGTVFYALDVVAPVFFKNKTVDLVVSGTNEGSNLGPLVFTLSGTQGAAYAAVGRGIPAVSFSAMNSTKRSYKTWNKDDPEDIANIQAKLAADLVSALAFGTNIEKGEKVLPISLGLSVNFPLINSTCKGLPFVQTRMTGNALTDKIRFVNGFPTWADLADSPGMNTCLNGDCSLPFETLLVTTTCSSSVTAFSVDYDSPQAYTEKVREHLEYTVLGKMNTSPGTYRKREFVPRGVVARRG